MALGLLVAREPEVAIFPARAEPDAQGTLTLLASLHDEARETIILGSLQNRAAYAVAGWSGFAAATIYFYWATQPVLATASWLLLMMIGCGAILRARMRAQSVEIGALRDFAADLNAMLIYCGIVWGMGAFLILGPDTTPLLLALFIAGGCAVTALATRNKGMLLGFTVPAAVLAIAASLFRPLPHGILGAGFVLIACAAISAATFWSRDEPAPTAACLADFEFSAEP